jgi:hypothetical protein
VKGRLRVGIAVTVGSAVVVGLWSAAVPAAAGPAPELAPAVTCPPLPKLPPGVPLPPLPAICKKPKPKPKPKKEKPKQQHAKYLVTIDGTLTYKTSFHQGDVGTCNGWSTTTGTTDVNFALDTPYTLVTRAPRPITVLNDAERTGLAYDATFNPTGQGEYHALDCGGPAQPVVPVATDCSQQHGGVTIHLRFDTSRVAILGIRPSAVPFNPSCPAPLFDGQLAQTLEFIHENTPAEHKAMRGIDAPKAGPVTISWQETQQCPSGGQGGPTVTLDTCTITGDFRFVAKRKR